MRIHFFESLQSCAQVHSYAPRYEDHGCEGRDWQRVGQAEEKTNMAGMKREKQTRYFWTRSEKKAKQFIVQRSWTCATSETPNWTGSSEKTQDVLCYVEAMWLMTHARVPCSPCRDLPRHPWQPPKFWMSFPDIPCAQDKQLMQNRLVRRSKWKMHHRYEKFPNRNVQIFGFVYQNTNDQNHGSVWKTQSFLSKGICTVTLWQDSCGKGKSRKVFWKIVGESFKLGMFICQPSSRTDLICVCGRYQNGRQNRRWLGRTNIFSWPRTIGLHSKIMSN